MAACPRCGRENADDARFCSSCGARLTTSLPAQEQRKVVTVLFCDLVGSTALGESTDPEVMRALLARTFDDLNMRDSASHHWRYVARSWEHADKELADRYRYALRQLDR